MRRKKLMIIVISIAVAAVLAFGGYNVYRRPAVFRSLSDNSLSKGQTEAVRSEIFAKREWTKWLS